MTRPAIAFGSNHASQTRRRQRKEDCHDSGPSRTSADSIAVGPVCLRRIQPQSDSSLYADLFPDGHVVGHGDDRCEPRGPDRRTSDLLCGAWVDTFERDEADRVSACELEHWEPVIG